MPSEIDEVFRDVRDERARQDSKWGADRNMPHDTWLRIVVEEVGESAVEIDTDGFDLDKLYAEVIQVAASAVAWAEALLRTNWSWMCQERLHSRCKRATCMCPCHKKEIENNG